MLWLFMACQQDNIRIFITEEHFGTIDFFVDAISDDRLEVVQSNNVDTGCSTI